MYFLLISISGLLIASCGVMYAQIKESNKEISELKKSIDLAQKSVDKWKAKQAYTDKIASQLQSENLELVKTVQSLKDRLKNAVHRCPTTGKLLPKSKTK